MKLEVGDVGYCSLPLRVMPPGTAFAESAQRTPADLALMRTLRKRPPSCSSCTEPAGVTRSKCLLCSLERCRPGEGGYWDLPAPQGGTFALEESGGAQSAASGVLLLGFGLMEGKRSE